jgi:hypothetical protein
MSTKTLKGTLIAGAVCAMFSAGTALAGSSGKSADVKCAGANSCKGQGSCSGADNSCKGQNSCKGKGWTHTASAKDCTDKGGTVMKDAPKKM